MAHPDFHAFHAFLARMNLDDGSMAALEAAEAGERANCKTMGLAV